MALTQTFKTHESTVALVWLIISIGLLCTSVFGTIWYIRKFKRQILLSSPSSFLLYAGSNDNHQTQQTADSHLSEIKCDGTHNKCAALSSIDTTSTVVPFLNHETSFNHRDRGVDVNRGEGVEDESQVGDGTMTCVQNKSNPSAIVEGNYSSPSPSQPTINNNPPISMLADHWLRVLLFGEDHNGGSAKARCLTYSRVTLWLRAGTAAVITIQLCFLVATVVLAGYYSSTLERKARHDVYIYVYPHSQNNSNNTSADKNIWRDSNQLLPLQSLVFGQADGICRMTSRIGGFEKVPLKLTEADQGQRGLLVTTVFMKAICAQEEENSNSPPNSTTNNSTATRSTIVYLAVGSSAAECRSAPLVRLVDRDRYSDGYGNNRSAALSLSALFFASYGRTLRGNENTSSPLFDMHSSYSTLNAFSSSARCLTHEESAQVQNAYSLWKDTAGSSSVSELLEGFSFPLFRVGGINRGVSNGSKKNSIVSCSVPLDPRESATAWEQNFSETSSGGVSIDLNKTHASNDSGSLLLPVSPLRDVFYRGGELYSGPLPLTGFGLGRRTFGSLSAADLPSTLNLTHLGDLKETSSDSSGDDCNATEFLFGGGASFSSLTPFIFVSDSGVEEVPRAVYQTGSTIRGEAPIFNGTFSDSVQYVGLKSTPFDLLGGSAADDNLRSAAQKKGVFSSLLGPTDEPIDSATISLWARLDENSRGFLFSIVDNWEVATSIEAEEGATNQTTSSENSSGDGGDIRVMNPILAAVSAALATNKDNVNSRRDDYFSSTWHLYLGLFADGHTKTLSLVTAVPTHASESSDENNTMSQASYHAGITEGFPPGVSEMKWGPSVASALFDGKWHLLTIQLEHENNARTAQLFIDAGTDFTSRDWHVCMASQSGFMPSIPTRAIPPYASVVGVEENNNGGNSNNITEKNPTAFGRVIDQRVKDGAALHIGVIKGSVYDLRIFEELLIDQAQMAYLGAPIAMRNALPIRREQSIVLGYTLMSFAIAGFVASVFFLARATVTSFRIKTTPPAQVLKTFTLLSHSAWVAVERVFCCGGGHSTAETSKNDAEKRQIKSEDTNAENDGLVAGHSDAPMSTKKNKAITADQLLRDKSKIVYWQRNAYENPTDEEKLEREKKERAAKVLQVSAAELAMSAANGPAGAGSILGQADTTLPSLGRTSELFSSYSPKDASSAAATAPSPVSVLAQSADKATLWLLDFLAPFLTVTQSLAIYVQGWAWPDEFKKGLEWITAWFSIDLTAVFPSIGYVVMPALQLFAAIVALAFLFAFLADDERTFVESVREGLGRPVPSGSVGKVLPLVFICESSLESDDEEDEEERAHDKNNTKNEVNTDEDGGVEIDEESIPLLRVLEDKRIQECLRALGAKITIEENKKGTLAACTTRMKQAVKSCCCLSISSKNGIDEEGKQEKADKAHLGAVGDDNINPEGVLTGQPHSAGHHQRQQHAKSLGLKVTIANPVIIRRMLNVLSSEATKPFASTEPPKAPAAQLGFNRFAGRGADRPKPPPKKMFDDIDPFFKVINGNTIAILPSETTSSCSGTAVLSSDGGDSSKPPRGSLVLRVDETTVRGVCPIHSRRLIEAVPTLHHLSQLRNGNSPYNCIFSDVDAEGLTFIDATAHLPPSTTATEEKDNTTTGKQKSTNKNISKKTSTKGKQRSKPREACPGVSDDFFVCPEDSCSYCLCSSCIPLAAKLLSKLHTQLYMIRRYGAGPLVGAVAIIAAESLYLPAIKTSLMIVSCHRAFWCHFSSCYDGSSRVGGSDRSEDDAFASARKGDPMYAAFATLSYLVLVVVGIGLVVFFSVMLWRRWNLIDGVLNKALDTDDFKDGVEHEIARIIAEAKLQQQEQEENKEKAKKESKGLEAERAGVDDGTVTAVRRGSEELEEQRSRLMAPARLSHHTSHSVTIQQTSVAATTAATTTTTEEAGTEEKGNGNGANGPQSPSSSQGFSAESLKEQFELLRWHAKRKMEEMLWSDILSADRSLLQALYASYGLRWMGFFPASFLFKSALVGVVVLTSPNGFPQAVSVATIEVLHMLFWLICNPFSKPLIAFLTHVGCAHQVAQLCLMSFHRADVVEDATQTRYGWAMWGLFISYLALFAVVIVITVVIPTLRSLLVPNPVRGASRKATACSRRAQVIIELYASLPHPNTSSEAERAEWVETVKTAIPPTGQYVTGKAHLLSISGVDEEFNHDEHSEVRRYVDSLQLSRGDFLGIQFHTRFIEKVIAYGNSFSAFRPSTRKKRYAVLAEANASLLTMERMIAAEERFLSEIWHVVEDHEFMEKAVEKWWQGAELRKKNARESVIQQGKEEDSLKSRQEDSSKNATNAVVPTAVRNQQPPSSSPSSSSTSIFSVPCLVTRMLERMVFRKESFRNRDTDWYIWPIYEEIEKRSHVYSLEALLSSLSIDDLLEIYKETYSIEQSSLTGGGLDKYGIQQSYGYTFVHAAKTEAFLEVLLKAGADIATRDPRNDERTALHHHVGMGNVDFVKVLLSYGAAEKCLNIRDKGARSPLMLAISTGNLAMAEVLAGKADSEPIIIKEIINKEVVEAKKGEEITKPKEGQEGQQHSQKENEWASVANSLQKSRARREEEAKLRYDKMSAAQSGDDTTEHNKNSIHNSYVRKERGSVYCNGIIDFRAESVSNADSPLVKAAYFRRPEMIDLIANHAYTVDPKGRALSNEDKAAMKEWHQQVLCAAVNVERPPDRPRLSTQEHDDRDTTNDKNKDEEEQYAVVRGPGGFVQKPNYRKKDDSSVDFRYTLLFQLTVAGGLASEAKFFDTTGARLGPTLAALLKAIPKDVLSRHVNDRDGKGMTPLMRACATGPEVSRETVDMFVDILGADVTAVCNEGRTALFYACSSGALHAAKAIVLAHGRQRVAVHSGLSSPSGGKEPDDSRARATDTTNTSDDPNTIAPPPLAFSTPHDAYRYALGMIDTTEGGKQIYVQHVNKETVTVKEKAVVINVSIPILAAALQNADAKRQEQQHPKGDDSLDLLVTSFAEFVDGLFGQERTFMSHMPPEEKAQQGDNNTCDLGEKAADNGQNERPAIIATSTSTRELIERKLGNIKAAVEGVSGVVIREDQSSSPLSLSKKTETSLLHPLVVRAFMGDIAAVSALMACLASPTPFSLFDHQPSAPAKILEPKCEEDAGIRVLVSDGNEVVEEGEAQKTMLEQMRAEARRAQQLRRGGGDQKAIALLDPAAMYAALTTAITSVIAKAAAISAQTTAAEKKKENGKSVSSSHPLRFSVPPQHLRSEEDNNYVADSTPSPVFSFEFDDLHGPPKNYPMGQLKIGDEKTKNRESEGNVKGSNDSSWWNGGRVLLYKKCLAASCLCWKAAAIPDSCATERTSAVRAIASKNTQRIMPAVVVSGVDVTTAPPITPIDVVFALECAVGLGRTSVVAAILESCPPPILRQLIDPPKFPPVSQRVEKEKLNPLLSSYPVLASDLSGVVESEDVSAPTVFTLPAPNEENCCHPCEIGTAEKEEDCKRKKQPEPSDEVLQGDIALTEREEDDVHSEVSVWLIEAEVPDFILLAARHGHTRVADVLYRKGFKARRNDQKTAAEINERFTRNSFTSFFDSMAAIVFADPSIGAMRNNVGQTLMTTAAGQAAQAKNMRLLDLFLKAGVDVNVKDADNFTPLHRSTFSVEVTKRVCEAGADVNAVDNNFVTPLSRALEFGYPDTAKYLIFEAGADYYRGDTDRDDDKKKREAASSAPPQRWFGPKGYSLLSVAVASNKPETVSALLSWSGVVDLPSDRNKDGSTVLHVAMDCYPMNVVPILKMLLAAKSKEKKSDENSQCAYSGSIDVNAQDSSGNTALHVNCAKYRPNEAATALLLEVGADANITNKMGVQALNSQKK